MTIPWIEKRVGHHAEQQVAGLLLVVELQRQLLEVGVELGAQVVDHALADVDRQVVGAHRAWRRARR